jgi:prepilin-type N-terminal cleavage/methylation domain-containing protein
MKPGSLKSGFTLIEMLAVVAIIAILVSMVVGITKRVDDQRKERLCRNTIDLIGNALEQFRDFGYEYKDNYYDGLVFPLDCNNYSVNPDTPPYPNIPLTFYAALYSPTAPSIIINAGPGWSQHDQSFSGSEALYFILSQVPGCRATLDKIDKSLLTNKGKDKTTDIKIRVPSGATAASTIDLPFTRVIDPWGTTLRYDYYPEYRDYILAYPTGNWASYLIYRNSAKKTFPVITSAGPDKQFDTADDISNVN